MIYRNHIHPIASRNRIARNPIAHSLCVVAAALLLPGCEGEEGAQRSDAPHIIASAEPKSVPAALARLNEFSKLSRALRQTELMPTLSGGADHMLFAPRDTAFAQMSAEEEAALFAPENRAALSRTLRTLIIPGAIRPEELRERIRNEGPVVLKSLAGTLVTVSAEGEMLRLTTASGSSVGIGTSALTTGNGLIYILDRWPG